VISGFGREAGENSALLGYYAAGSGNGYIYKMNRSFPEKKFEMMT